jgi:Family of unknown function (DUF6343)/Protein of unknown function (DUF3099)
MPIPYRSGSEPARARSALRMRLFFAVFGGVCAIAGVIAFALIGNVAWLAASAALVVGAAVNSAVVIHRIRQGARFQPGRGTPILPPVLPRGRPLPGPPARAPRLRARRRAYLIMMGCCLTLFVLAWSLVSTYSVPGAVAMSVVAALIPPIAVIIANTGVTGGDGGGRRRGDRRSA